MMSCAHKALLVVMLMMTLGLWGCTQNRGSGSTAAKIRDLETRNAKLEEDYRAAVADGSDLRNKLQGAEDQVARLSKQAAQVPVLLKDRDRLRQQVQATTSERAALQAQMQQFSRDLQALAGKVDAAAGGSTGQPVTSTTSTASPGSL
jgi:chromosome segregation ATPase